MLIINRYNNNEIFVFFKIKKNEKKIINYINILYFYSFFALKNLLINFIILIFDNVLFIIF
jgi:hypothetical protein